jgi:hypothetical protein
VRSLERLSLVASAILLSMFMVAHCCPLLGQVRRNNFWIAGRYDGDRVIIYFDAVKFNGTFPPDARRMIDPVAEGFFTPFELPATYIAQLQVAPGSERFALGGEYDLLTGGDKIPVKLTTLIGTRGDEEVGNNSYIGALATVVGPCTLFATKGYYVVRRHQEPVCGTKRRPGDITPRNFAALVNEPVRFDIQRQIVSLLTQRMDTLASDQQRRGAGGHPPLFAVHPFRVADGSLRYYATARWTGSKPAPSDFSLGAWLAPTPTLRILAVETNRYGDLPQIVNVVNLGPDRTGIILTEVGEDSVSTDAVEYRDGLDVANMPILQSIAAGE